jgi:hypothetical protein
VRSGAILPEIDEVEMPRAERRIGHTLYHFRTVTTARPSVVEVCLSC